ASRCDPEAHARIDAAEFKQILLNLVLNAIEAAPPRSAVRITIKSNPGAILLAVSDEGPGVAAEHAPRIFEPFFTTRKTGSGLGLAISRQLATNAGGALELDRLHKPGARFILTLPAAELTQIKHSEITSSKS